MKHLTPTSLLLPLLLAVLASCTEPAAFKDYRDLPAEGWRAKDTLTFQIDTIRRAAPYEVLLGIRTSSARAYPFQQLTIVAEQEWRTVDKDSVCSQRDTLNITLTNALGDVQGKGVSNYEYLLPLAQLQLHPGHRGRIRIYHLMRRHTLQGITNVGLELSPL